MMWPFTPVQETTLQRLRGVRTYLLHIASAALVIALALLDYLGTFDWTSILEPKHAGYAMLIVNLLSIAFRATNRRGHKE